MSILVPDQPTGQLTDAWRQCVGAGRFDLASRRDCRLLGWSLDSGPVSEDSR